MAEIWATLPRQVLPERKSALQKMRLIQLPTQGSVLIIEPGRSERNYWRDLWRYRELFLILAWRDISVRYKQTVLGVAWAILQPLLTTVVFTFVFGGLANLPSDGETPYSLMVLTGMLPWAIFSGGLTNGSNSLLSNSNLITKVYFPRLLMPLAAIVVSLVDFFVALAILFGLMLFYQVGLHWQIVLLPALIALAFLAAVGPALFFTSFSVKYRDFRYVIPFLVQLGLYVSPVGFSSQLVPAKYQMLFYLNPMAGIIDAFRWCILGAESPYLPIKVTASCVVVGLCLWFGIVQFRKTERSFADVI